MDFLRFVMFATLAAIGYGIAHDLVTAHVAVEYFTVHHPRLVASTSPIVMALLWGVLATFWFGAGLGVLVGAANLLGRAPRLEWPLVRSGFLKTLVGLWVSALLVLLGVYAAAGLVPAIKRGPSFESDRRLVAVAVTHNWSYTAGGGCGFALAGWVVVRRRKLARAARAS